MLREEMARGHFLWLGKTAQSHLGHPDYADHIAQTRCEAVCGHECRRNMVRMLAEEGSGGALLSHLLQRLMHHRDQQMLLLALRSLRRRPALHVPPFLDALVVLHHRGPEGAVIRALAAVLGTPGVRVEKDPLSPDSALHCALFLREQRREAIVAFLVRRRCLYRRISRTADAILLARLSGEEVPFDGRTLEDIRFFYAAMPEHLQSERTAELIRAGGAKK